MVESGIANLAAASNAARARPPRLYRPARPPSVTSSALPLALYYCLVCRRLVDARGVETRSLHRSTAPAHHALTADVLSEPWRVVCWRLAQLAEAGYTDEASGVLASCLDVDLHRATDLLRRGCPHATALRILL